MAHLKKYWAGFKDGKLFNEIVGCDDGDFLVPALYVSKKVAERERDENKKFDEVRRVEVNEIGTKDTNTDD